MPFIGENSDRSMFPATDALRQMKADEHQHLEAAFVSSMHSSLYLGAVHNQSPDSCPLNEEEMFPKIEWSYRLENALFSEPSTKDNLISDKLYRTLAKELVVSKRKQRKPKLSRVTTVRSNLNLLDQSRTSPRASPSLMHLGGSARSSLRNGPRPLLVVPSLVCKPSLVSLVPPLPVVASIAQRLRGIAEAEYFC